MRRASAGQIKEDARISGRLIGLPKIHYMAFLPCQYDSSGAEPSSSVLVMERISAV